MHVSGYLAGLICVALFIASLPFGDGLSMIVSFILLLTLAGILLRWALLLPLVVPARVALAISLSLFVTSVLSRAASRGVLIVVSVIVALCLVCLTIVARKAMVDQRALKAVVFSAIAVVGLALRVLLYTSFGNMKQGDFWTVHLPFNQALILPHPYDRLVPALIPVVLWSSLLLAVGLSAFSLRRQNSAR